MEQRAQVAQVIPVAWLTGGAILKAGETAYSVAKELAQQMGTTDELLYERKHILGSADSKQFSFTVGDDIYTILTSESVGGRNESQMRIGMKDDLIQLKRNEGEAVWRTPGRYGREFRTLEEIIKYIRK